MTEGRTVLLVANNIEDVELVRNGFERLGLGSRLEVVADVDQAMRYLRAEGPFWDRQRFPTAEIVLLDWNLPKTRQVLERIRKTPQLKHLPVIVLTQSEAWGDVKQAYRLGANSFLEKQGGVAAFQAGLKETVDFWLIGRPGELPASRGPLMEQELQDMGGWGQQGTGLAA